MIEVRLIEQIFLSSGERNQNLASTFWRRLWGLEQKAVVVIKKSEASEKQWRQEEVVLKGVI